MWVPNAISRITFFIPLDFSGEAPRRNLMIRNSRQCIIRELFGVMAQGRADIDFARSFVAAASGDAVREEAW